MVKKEGCPTKDKSEKAGKKQIECEGRKKLYCKLFIFESACYHDSNRYGESCAVQRRSRMVYVENELIGRRLERIRKRMGYELSDMAEILGVSTGQYRKIERGIYGLDVKKILILYSKLQIDPLYLLTGNRRKDSAYVPYGAQDNNSLVCELLDYCRTKLTEDTEE